MDGLFSMLPIRKAVPFRKIGKKYICENEMICMTQVWDKEQI